MRVEKPVEYCKVIASILPKEFEITENKLVEMPDDELDAVIEFARRSLERRTITATSREIAEIEREPLSVL
jgi:hypothetical protein